jgi:hypothetical protein
MNSKATLKELFRAHSPYSVLNDNSNDGHGQQNLDVCRHRMNRPDRNLVRNVINQSKIIWVLGTFV